ncbi:hypothetical protein [Pseudanabaena sp. UWO310]|uniref:hypothetical protein n=1 Tax=Pseudanabaena sp. UWO310 TaxID=2480795 RepID=UPI00115C1C6A|nr:hypothetical protein [Pseudanabaena sp. UWO310]TYQ29975.1 hypothetical protein PseudUWO310_11180 [Pseudanabaena sp. UWO310]
MQTTDKVRTGIYLSPKVDEALRFFAVRHRKSNSDIVEAALLHCLENRHFIDKFTKKKEEAIPY